MECQTLQECCQLSCDAGAAAGLSCWPSNGNCGCAGLPEFPPACDAAYQDLYRCVAAAPGFGYTCSANNSAILVCGVCDEVAAVFGQACGGGTPPCQ